LTRPVVQSAATLAALDEGGEVNALIDQLALQVNASKAGDQSRTEEMLLSQAHVLDGLFNWLCRVGVGNLKEHYLNAGEQYLRLALKAQSQCRTTLETLAEIKSPRPVAFVRQANIANGPQQVNNGTRAEMCEIPPNKLLGALDGERLDLRAANSTIRSDQALEAVGAIDRTADERG
jgi:hypothetical protein